MARPKRPPPDQRIRLHYLNEWAKERELNQAEIAESLDVDSGTVSRWFDSALPSEFRLPRIAGVLKIDLDELFRAPNDNWLRRFFDRRNDEEKRCIKEALERLFPDKVA